MTADPAKNELRILHIPALVHIESRYRFAGESHIRCTENQQRRRTGAAVRYPGGADQVLAEEWRMPPRRCA